MRKLKLKMSVSLDGFVGGPKGESDWMFEIQDKEVSKLEVREIWKAGVHIMGSRTFRDMKAYWPTSTEIYAAPMNEIPKIAFSRKGIPNKEWNKTTPGFKDVLKFVKTPLVKAAADSDWDDSPILTGDLATHIRRLKKQSGKPILAHGGAGFAQSLIATGLIDEFLFLIYPVAIGKGLPIFTKLKDSLELKLVSSKKFKSGILANVYKPS
ncbi:MAG: dihydrofolate reductase [Cyclobacteriaceae bacterium]|nr:dihydrofolate reductase [Cyclobacteriaceae bacterium]